MREEEYVYGMKVVVNKFFNFTLDEKIEKTSSERYLNSLIRIRKQGYAFLRKSGVADYVVDASLEDKIGWYVNLEDVEPYKEKESLLDKVFKVHNEVTLKDGSKFIVTSDNIINEINGSNRTLARKNFNNKLKHSIFVKYEITKVVNPFTQKIVYERKEDVKLYDGFGNTLIIQEDGNENILELTINEDSDEEGKFNHASFELTNTEAKKLYEVLKEKFNF